VLTDHSGLSPFERLLTLFTRMRPGEGRSAGLFFLHGFLLLFSYQILKALREAFILTKFSAEVRSYAVAVIAIVLMVLVPLYGLLRRRYDGARLLHVISVVFAVITVMFGLAARSGMNIAFPFYIWGSIYGVMVIAQFWAFAADNFNLKSGQRLFPVIMVGANLGALAGAKFAELAVAALTPLGLVMVSAAVLLSTIAITGPERRAVPDGSRAIPVEAGRPPPKLLGGIGLVLRDRYLLMIALLVVLLNWVNSTGEFILADVVQRAADAQIAESGGTLDKGSLITAFYGTYFFWVTLVGLLIQLFVVSRVYQLVGVRGALLVQPVVVAIGYGIIGLMPLLGGFIPVFSLIRLVKIAENSLDYSLMNTTRHALFLPVDRDAKYEGKTAIDTFFWRFGDLLQAGAVFVGVNLLNWTPSNFALLNLLLAIVWLGLAIAIGREFATMAQRNVINVAPQVGAAIPDLTILPGRTFQYRVATDAFFDADPGDVLHLRAQLPGGRPLPRWMRFDARHRLFTGQPPAEFTEELTVEVVASDVDGMEVTSCFVVRRTTS
jgi:AAA family ATP:ADP antiporter